VEPEEKAAARNDPVYGTTDREKMEKMGVVFSMRSAASVIT
jgi:hypothetical protein